MLLVQSRKLLKILHMIALVGVGILVNGRLVERGLCQFCKMQARSDVWNERSARKVNGTEIACMLMEL